MSRPPQVYGVRDTLRTLGGIDKALRTQAIRDIKKAAEPMRGAVAAAIPTAAPLSGWAHRGRTGWSAKGRKVTTQYGGRARAERDVWPLVRVSLTGASGSVFDMAGKSSSGQFAQALTRAEGRPSRAVWPTAERFGPATEAAVRGALRTITAQINRDLVERGPR